VGLSVLGGSVGGSVLGGLVGGKVCTGWVGGREGLYWMGRWLVALPGFLNFSYFSGIVNVTYLVITAAPSLLILCSVEAILIAQ